MTQKNWQKMVEKTLGSFLGGTEAAKAHHGGHPAVVNVVLVVITGRSAHLFVFPLSLLFPLFSAVLPQLLLLEWKQLGVIPLSEWIRRSC